MYKVRVCMSITWRLGHLNIANQCIVLTGMRERTLRAEQFDLFAGIIPQVDLGMQSVEVYELNGNGVYPLDTVTSAASA